MKYILKWLSIIFILIAVICLLVAISYWMDAPKNTDSYSVLDLLDIDASFFEDFAGIIYRVKAVAFGLLSLISLIPGLVCYGISVTLDVQENIIINTSRNRNNGGYGEMYQKSKWMYAYSETDNEEIKEAIDAGIAGTELTVIHNLQALGNHASLCLHVIAKSEPSEIGKYTISLENPDGMLLARNTVEKGAIITEVRKLINYTIY